MKKSKITVLVLTMALLVSTVLTGCSSKSNSVMPIIDITMKMSNEDLKDAFGEAYDDSEYDDGKTVITATAGDIDVTVHVNWDGDAIKTIWLEAMTTKDNYAAFEKLITDFYKDLTLENQADVIENGTTTYKDIDISYIHFIEQGNVFLYVGNEEAEKEEASEQEATSEADSSTTEEGTTASEEETTSEDTTSEEETVSIE